MTRDEIEQRVEENLEKIRVLESENVELKRQALLLSDDVQWFTEEIESHPKKKYQRSPNYLDGKLVGRVHWNEHVIDEDTGEVIELERSRIVRVNGEWV